MKHHTSKTLIAAVLATALASVSVSAIAQSGTPPLKPQPKAAATDPARMAERQQAMQARMSERHARHMERLKAELKLSPEQEAAWKAFVVRTEPQPFKAPAQDWSKMTTPQRLDAQQALHAERSAEMAQRIEATKSFYAQLTPEQQKIFDAQSRGYQRAAMKDGHSHGGKGHHGAHPHGGWYGMGGGMGCDGPMGGAGGPGGPGPRS